MVNGQDSQLSEPPVTVKHSDEDISKFALESSRMSDHMMQHFPCHTQTVEREIKLATEALLSVAGQGKRDCMIENEIKSGCKMSKLDSKNDFSI